MVYQIRFLLVGQGESTVVSLEGTNALMRLRFYCFVKQILISASFLDFFKYSREVCGLGLSQIRGELISSSLILLPQFWAFG